jgi:hypothetical protein
MSDDIAPVEVLEEIAAIWRRALARTEPPDTGIRLRKPVEPASEAS